MFASCSPCADIRSQEASVQMEVGHVNATFLNASAYKFVQIPEGQLEDVRSQLKTGAPPGLCGTILLSQEGINIRLSGPPKAVKAFPPALEASFAGFRDIHWKFTGTK
jgi:predicted sulfurtransferase